MLTLCMVSLKALLTNKLTKFSTMLRCFLPRSSPVLFSIFTSYTTHCHSSYYFANKLCTVCFEIKQKQLQLNFESISSCT